MLTFKKGSYTKEQLSALHYALHCAQLMLCESIDGTDCTSCKNARPCKDLQSVVDYISNLISKRTRNV